jgi:hypothetical protein
MIFEYNKLQCNIEVIECREIAELTGAELMDVG